jgi:hypothetical protein
MKDEGKRSPRQRWLILVSCKIEMARMFAFES